MMYFFGSGDHARVLLSLLHESGMQGSIHIIDQDPDSRTRLICGRSYPVLHESSMTEEEVCKGSSFVLGIGGLEHVGTRKRLAEKMKKMNSTPHSIVSPRACIHDRATLQLGVQVLCKSFIHLGCEIDEHVIVNTGAQIDHDCTIGSYCHIAPGAILGGNVTVEAEVHVGMGAIILEGRRVGNGAIVGAGSVVTKDVAPGVVVVGNPAKEIVR